MTARPMDDSPSQGVSAPAHAFHWPNLTWSELLGPQGEIRFPSYSDEELIEVSATSPLAGLLPAVPEGWIPGVGKAARRLLDREEAELDASRPGPLRLRASGDLALLVALRRQPALVATVTAIGAPETHEVQSAGTLAVLFGLAVVGHGLVGLLEEVRDEVGIHHFTLAKTEVEARRIEATCEALARDNPDSGILIEAFSPAGECPGHLRMLLRPAGEKAWEISETSTGDAQPPSVLERRGEAWVALFAGAMRGLLAAPQR